MKTILLFISLSITSFADAQIIYGVVTDSATKEPLVNASITVKKGDIVKGGAATDFDGRFSIGGLDSGDYKIGVSYVGYKTITILTRVEGDKKTELNCKLASSSTNTSSNNSIRTVVIRYTPHYNHSVSTVKRTVEPFYWDAIHRVNYNKEIFKIVHGNFEPVKVSDSCLSNLSKRKRPYIDNVVAGYKKTGHSYIPL